MLTTPEVFWLIVFENGGSSAPLSNGSPNIWSAAVPVYETCAPRTCYTTVPVPEVLDSLLDFTLRVFDGLSGVLRLGKRECLVGSVRDEEGGIEKTGSAQQGRAYLTQDKTQPLSRLR